MTEYDAALLAYNQAPKSGSALIVKEHLDCDPNSEDLKSGSALIVKEHLDCDPNSEALKSGSALNVKEHLDYDPNSEALQSGSALNVKEHLYYDPNSEALKSGSALNDPKNEAGSSTNDPNKESGSALTASEHLDLLLMKTLRSSVRAVVEKYIEQLQHLDPNLADDKGIIPFPSINKHFILVICLSFRFSFFIFTCMNSAYPIHGRPGVLLTIYIDFPSSLSKKITSGKNYIHNDMDSINHTIEWLIVKPQTWEKVFGINQMIPC